MTFEDAKVLVSAISAIIALGSAIAVFYQARKSWYIDVIAKQRLEWAENLRRSLSVLITAYGEGQDVQGPKACVELYLSPENSNHKELLAALNNLCTGSAQDCKSIVVAAQDLLHLNWWTVKAESLVSYRYELKRDKKVKDRLEIYKADIQKRKEGTSEAGESTEKASGDTPKAP